MNKTDKKVLGIGAVVLVVALMGSITGSTPYVPPAGVTGEVFGLKVGTGEASASLSGTTTEGETTTLSLTIPAANITKASFVFSYSDDIYNPLTGDNDQFTVAITAPNGEEKSVDIASGETTATIDFTFTAQPGIENKTYDSRARAEAAAEKLVNSTGSGNYTVKVTATFCPGRSPLGIFDLDTGNDWTISVSYEYYTISVFRQTEAKE